MRQSFTLFELLVVILIMAIVYAISFAFFDKQSFFSRNQTTDFREKMMKAKQEKDSVLKLICFEDDECILEENGKRLDDFSFDGGAKMVFFDMKEEEIDREFEESETRYKKNVNFEYALHPNAVFDSAVLELGNSYVALAPMVWMTDEFDTLSEAKDYLFSNEIRKYSIAK